MDGTGRRDRVLEGIVAILLSLALLAERAANRSFPVRWLLLAILRRAETVAGGHFAALTGCEWPCSGDSGETGSGPADMLLLAARLQALAASLAALLPAADRLAGRAAGRCGRAAEALAPLLLLVAVFPSRLPARPPDTS